MLFVRLDIIAVWNIVNFSIHPKSRDPRDPCLLLRHKEFPDYLISRFWEFYSPWHASLHTLVLTIRSLPNIKIKRTGIKKVNRCSIFSVIEPGRRERHYWLELWRYRELFQVLAWRDLSVRYKQTIIGVVGH